MGLFFKIILGFVVVSVVSIFLFTGGIEDTRDYFSLQNQIAEVTSFLPVVCPRGFTAERGSPWPTESYLDCSVINSEDKMPEDFFNATLDTFLSNGWSINHETREHSAYDVIYYLSKTDTRDEYSIEFPLQKENHKLLWPTLTLRIYTID